MSALSGGQAARANLAAILLARFDVFLLDEPTNDLDFAGLDRLERFLRSDLAGGAVIVSPRPVVPRSHDHERVGARRARAHRVGVRGRLGRVPRGTGDRAPPRRGGLRDLRQPARGAPQPVAGAAAVVGAGQGEGREERRDRQVHPPLPAQQQRARCRQGQDHRPGARTARSERGREAVGELGPPHGDRGRTPRRRGRRPARRRGRAPRDVHPRAGRSRDPLRRARRAPRRQRQRQDDAARRRARTDPARRGRGAPRPGRGDRRARPGPRRVRRHRAVARALRARERSRAERGSVAARQVRARRRTRDAPGRLALAG